MQWSPSSISCSPFHGHITRAELLGSDGGLARLRLVIEPWLSFLAHRTDAWVFQRKTVVQIVEEVFADYVGQGKLVPAWRWDLTDASVYPERSLCIQYRESDLDFVQRLLIEEGLFCWIEHQGKATDASLGAHTLVIADHNGAFKPGAQARVRFTQALLAPAPAPAPDLNSLAALLPEDSLSRWRRTAAVHSASLELASPDYRALSLRAQSQCADPATLGAAGAVPLPELSLADIPGAYAYEDAAQGQRLALRQMQALDAQREQVQARGSLRSAAPGSTFTLLDHAEHDGLDPSRDRFVTLSVQHRARNVSVWSWHLELSRVTPEHRGHGEHGGCGLHGGDGGGRALSERLLGHRLDAQAGGGLLDAPLPRQLFSFSRRPATGGAAAHRFGGSIASATG